MKRGPWLVDPGLGLPEHHLTEDEQVRGLSYLIKRMDEIAPVECDIEFEIFPMRAKFGGLYPAIGLFTRSNIYTDESLFDLGMELGERLEAYIEREGVKEIVKQSSGESLTWQDVLDLWEIGPDHPSLKMNDFLNE